MRAYERLVLKVHPDIARVKAIMSSKKSQEVAQAYARKFRSTCKEVAEKLDGAAASN